MAFAGTFVTSGQASGVVVATAGRTEIGRISELVGKVESIQTPLLKKIAQLARQLTAAILVVSVVVFAFGVFVKHQPAREMFLVAVGLAVAAIPEGLPAIVTITLAIGVNRMARRNAIIRRLPAVETLGSVTVICSDKTGTLTRNEMTVTTVMTADMALTATGSGYDPHGEIRRDGKTFAIEESGLLMEIARAGMLCNDSSLRQEDGLWRISGDPTEAALIVFGVKCGIDKQLIGESWPRVDVIPFESQHRFMATLNHDHNGRRVIYIKGAPETLLEKCLWQRSNSGKHPLDKEYWQKRLEEIAKNGQRSLAIACKETKENQQTLSFEDVGSDLVLLGLCGIIDPPREEAMQAVGECQHAGIRVKMITGDHRLTAQAIGNQMGIGTGTVALSGEQLEHADKNTLLRYAADVDIFGRVSPEHKLILVRALQAQGHVVAMTGDGVNDAPALKQADVGIAMGIKGTEVAKEASEVVLADDNFASIAHAVSEGRTVYDNIRKSIIFILPTNAAQAIVIITAVFLGYLLPITPVQILWVNMVTAVTLALSLAFEPAESDVMNRPPREPAEPILSGFLIWRIIFVSAILVAGTFGLFLWELARDTHIEAARTIAVNMLVMFEVFYLVNSRYLFRSVLSLEGLFGNRYVLLTMALIIALQLCFTYLAPMQHLFKTVSLGWAEWSRIIAIAPSVFVIVEIEKALFRLKK
jgi:potassium/sodium efflux P-type ATPase